MTHRNSWFTHENWWFSIVFCMFTRGYPLLGMIMDYPNPRSPYENQALNLRSFLNIHGFPMSKWSTCMVDFLYERLLEDTRGWPSTYCTMVNLTSQLDHGIMVWKHHGVLLRTNWTWWVFKCFQYQCELSKHPPKMDNLHKFTGNSGQTFSE